MAEKEYTRTYLRKITGCPGYLITYLTDCNRLPIIKESNGRGYPTIYHSDAVEIIKEHMEKRSR